MKVVFVIGLLCATVQGCTQSGARGEKISSKHIGGPCEGCEALYESPRAFSKLDWIDTLPDFHEAGPKLLLSGTVYQRDGRTLAPGVVVYVYHTDQQGIYATTGNETGWGKRHGYIRGWVKTNRQGQYRFYTLKPAPYPGRKAPAHIHMTLKEPEGNEYWIDDVVFADDPLLTEFYKNALANRGGRGVVSLQQSHDMLGARRDVILGKNIPGYPVALSDAGSAFGFGFLYVFR